MNRGGRAHRQRHVGEDHQPRLVLGAPDGDRGERDAVEAHVAAHRAAGVDPARAPATLRLWVSPPCSERASRRSDSSSSIRSCSPTPVDLGDLPLVRASTTRCSSASSASRCRLDRLRQPLEHAGEPAAQRGGVVLVALLRLVRRRRSASPAAPPAAATDRSASTFVPCCWLICPGMPASCSAVGLDLHPVALALRPCVVLGEHDLVGHRGEVDLVGLLVEVVLLGEVLGLEEVADVDGLAVRRGPAAGCRWAPSESVKSSSAPWSDEVVVAVPVAVPRRRCRPPSPGRRTGRRSRRTSPRHAGP